jgi:hypothetical protein
LALALPQVQQWRQVVWLLPAPLSRQAVPASPAVQSEEQLEEGALW